MHFFGVYGGFCVASVLSGRLYKAVPPRHAGNIVPDAASSTPRSKSFHSYVLANRNMYSTVCTRRDPESLPSLLQRSTRRSSSFSVTYDARPWLMGARFRQLNGVGDKVSALHGREVSIGDLSAEVGQSHDTVAAVACAAGCAL